MAWLPRVEAPELLDLNAGNMAETAESLADLRRINRWLGGTQVLTQHLLPRLAEAARETGRPVVVADIGTGSADIPVAIAEWARKNGVAVRVLAVDLNHRHLLIARDAVAGYPEITLVVGEAGNLPFREGVDYIVASLFLHHFPPEDVVRLLRAWFATARRGIVANDLIRSVLPYLGYFVLQPWIARSYLTRYDAPLSIRRAYTLAEMAYLAAEAGVPGRLTWHWPWRLALVADKVVARSEENP